MTASGWSWACAESTECGPASRQPCLLVVAAHEPLVRPGRLEDLVELGLAHHVTLGVADVEELDRLVEGGAVDDRVMWRQRDTQDVGELVLERAGQVIVDLVVAERQRLGDRAFRRGRRDRRALGERREALLRRRYPRPGARHACGGGKVECFEDEGRDPSCTGAAVVGGVRQDQLVAGAGHRDVAQPPLFGERRRRRSAALRGRGQPAGPAGRPDRWTGSGRRPCQAGTRPGTRGPSPCER